MASKISKYNHTKVEAKWQDNWKKSKIYSPDVSKAKNPFYNLWMFPYPSGEGLHAGHAFASTGSDVFGRYKRMNNHTVFQPIGYDSFGIHSENFAIKTGETPQKMLSRTTKNYERQLKSLGHGYDWRRTVTTSDLDYYRWTQWLFVELFKAGLAYRHKAAVNWCPSCKTVLADEQVIDEACERCETKVETKKLEQWFFRITDYADKLLTNLDKINWSNRVVTTQRNWIGKSTGHLVKFDDIEVYTTRLDTINGATFLVLSPEIAKNYLKLVPKDKESKVSEYIKKALSKSEQERKVGEKGKTGVDMGFTVENPANKKNIPIWVADYVLSGVGTGAIMAVPCDDERDAQFAKKHSLPVTKSKTTKSEQASLIKKGIAKKQTNYHLRDWLISRQRYWGPPIPMIFCASCAKNGNSYLKKSDWDSAGWYPEEKLPVELPVLKDYKPKGTGRGPLADHPEFYEVDCPHCDAPAKRETDVSDTFLDSAWYFLRYPSVGSHTTKLPWDPKITKKWLPVNLYFGGPEHAVLHLMYVRFINMVLYDLKHLPASVDEEPFPHFYANGLMIKDGAKMSKSKGNVVNPDKYVKKFGADTLRLYLMFMGPMDGSPDFRDEGIEGMQRFVNRVWTLFSRPLNPSSQSIDIAVTSKLHQTIKKVTEDIQEFKYNTAIASIMELVNTLREHPQDSQKKNLIVLAQLLAPFTPHMSEEAWEMLDQKGSVHTSIWPSYESKYIQSDQTTVIIQVNGKLRSQITIDQKSNNKNQITSLAQSDPKVSKHLKNKEIKKIIYVPNKILNFVV